MGNIKKVIRSAAKAIGVLKIYHLLLAWLPAFIYGYPARRMTVVGITGTKGKTTVAELVTAILTHAGEKVVLSSSYAFRAGDKVWINKTGNTMPGRGKIQKLLRRGVKEGCKYGVIEVVSEGVVQYRHKFLDFDVAVFTGLHPEHIESHGGFEQYREAKLNFFRDAKNNSKKKNKKFVINKASEDGKYFREIAGEDAILYEKYDGPLSLIGEFNKENAGAAAAVARALGVREDTIRHALEEFAGVPGRMDFVKEEPFRVVVDYAHTPGSLEAAYRALGEKGGGLICVFGSDGGGRDKWKRPKLGEIASRYCREVVLTVENPYDEDPKTIIKEIRAGIRGEGPAVHEVLDRGEAIEKAVSLALPGETVVITGKGTEPYMRLSRGKKIPWSDRDVALRAIADK